MTEKFRQGLLLLGAVIGLAVAALEAVTWRFAPDGRDAAAIVNDVVIPRADYQQMLNLLSSSRVNGALTPQDRQYVLNRLVEEELLFQRAEEIGLMRNHRALQASIVRAMVGFILDDASSAPPSDEVLAAFYQKHQAWFTPKEQLRVVRIYLRPEQAKLAQEVAARLKRGENFAALAKRLAAKNISSAIEIPDRLLPRDKLFEYLGEDLTERVGALAVGGIIGPIESEAGIDFLWLRGRQKPSPPRFEDIKPRVATYYAQRRDDERLKNYITGLRDQAKIELFP